MKRSSISSAVSIGLGVMLFFLGLFILVDEQNAVNLFTWLSSDTKNLQIAAIVFQGIGALLVLNGTLKMFGSELKTRNTENQALLFGLIQRVERVEKRTTDIAAKVISIENSRSLKASVPDSRQCRFCGAGIEHGNSFCPTCGKSQK